jgi:hypothetical protein
MLLLRATVFHCRWRGYSPYLWLVLWLRMSLVPHGSNKSCHVVECWLSHSIATVMSRRQRVLQQLTKPSNSDSDINFKSVIASVHTRQQQLCNRRAFNHPCLQISCTRGEGEIGRMMCLSHIGIEYCHLNVTLTRLLCSIFSERFGSVSSPLGGAAVSRCDLIYFI